MVIDHHPDNGTMRPPCSRTGFNFNLFNVGKLVQHVCLKLLWHSVLLWKGIVSSRHEYQQKKVAFFPFQLYHTICKYLFHLDPKQTWHKSHNHHGRNNTGQAPTYDGDLRAENARHQACIVATVVIVALVPGLL